MRKITRKVRMYRGKRRFSYYNNGERISDKDVLSRIDSLRIPPAWNDVEINLSKNANRLVLIITLSKTLIVFIKIKYFLAIARYEAFTNFCN